MCQLLGMNCNVPTDIIFSFTGFSTRGGRTDHHNDGWGIAFFEGNGVRHFVDYQAAVASPIAELIKSCPIKSKNVISHIRKATQGRVALENLMSEGKLPSRREHPADERSPLHTIMNEVDELSRDRDPTDEEKPD